MLSDCSYRGVEGFTSTGSLGFQKRTSRKESISIAARAHIRRGGIPHISTKHQRYGAIPISDPGTNPTTEAAKSLHNNLKENIDENTVNGHKEVKESGESSKLASATALLNHPAAV